MVCELRAGASREGFAVLDMALATTHLRLELRGDRVLLHEQHATHFLDCQQALHTLLRRLMLQQTVEVDA